MGVYGRKGKESVKEKRIVKKKERDIPSIPLIITWIFAIIVLIFNVVASCFSVVAFFVNGFDQLDGLWLFFVIIAIISILFGIGWAFFVPDRLDFEELGAVIVYTLIESVPAILAFVLSLGYTVWWA